METSSPVAAGNRREVNVSQESITSTNDSKSDLPSPFILEGSENHPSDQEENVEIRSPTGASFEFDKTALTPTKRPDNSEEFEGGANAMIDTAKESSIIHNSLPEHLRVYLSTVNGGGDDSRPGSVDVLLGTVNRGGDDSRHGVVDVLLDGLDLSSNPSFGETNQQTSQESGGIDKEASPPSSPVGPRRRLTFGSNLSPAIAGLRATPEMTPVKRALERDGSTELGTPSKRQFRNREGVTGVKCFENITKEEELKGEKVNVIARLMGARPRSCSGQASFKRKKNKQAIDGRMSGNRQRSISSMLSTWSSECIKSGSKSKCSSQCIKSSFKSGYELLEIEKEAKEEGATGVKHAVGVQKEGMYGDNNDLESLN